MKPAFNFRSGKWFCVGYGVMGSGDSATAAWAAFYSKVMANGALKRATYQPKRVGA